jgi:hypothetical protein
MRASNLAGLAHLARALAVGLGFVFLMSLIMSQTGLAIQLGLAVGVVSLLTLGRFLDAWADSEHEQN